MIAKAIIHRYLATVTWTSQHLLGEFLDPSVLIDFVFLIPTSHNLGDRLTDPHYANKPFVLCSQPESCNYWTHCSVWLLLGRYILKSAAWFIASNKANEEPVPKKDVGSCDIVFERRYSLATSSLPIAHRCCEYRLWTVAVIKQIALFPAKITHTPTIQETRTRSGFKENVICTVVAVVIILHRVFSCIYNALMLQTILSWIPYNRGSRGRKVYWNIKLKLLSVSYQSIPCDFWQLKREESLFFCDFFTTQAVMGMVQKCSISSDITRQIASRPRRPNAIMEGIPGPNNWIKRQKWGTMDR